LREFVRGLSAAFRFATRLCVYGVHEGKVDDPRFRVRCNHAFSDALGVWLRVRMHLRANTRAQNHATSLNNKPLTQVSREQVAFSPPLRTSLRRLPVYFRRKPQVILGGHQFAHRLGVFAGHCMYFVCVRVCV